jgi:hypothetical protein
MEVLTEKTRGLVTRSLSGAESPNVIRTDFWKNAENAGPKTKEAIDEQIATLTVNLICQNDDASHVLLGLLRSGRLGVTESRRHTIARALRKARSDQTKCPSVHNITDAVWSGLKSQGINTDGVAELP